MVSARIASTRSASVTFPVSAAASSCLPGDPSAPWPLRAEAPCSPVEAAPLGCAAGAAGAVAELAAWGLAGGVTPCCAEPEDEGDEDEDEDGDEGDDDEGEAAAS
jgi:hypothetical protein